MFAMRHLLACLLLAAGCDPPVKVGTNSPDDVFEVADVANLAELQRVLTIKGCEGWTYVDSYPYGEQFVLIVSRHGPPPSPNPKCRQ